MKFIKNLKKIALIFFFIIGALYIFSWMMAINNYYVNPMRLLNKITELPFIFIALVYGFLNLKDSLDKSKKHKIFDIVFIALMIIIFSAVLYINFFIPAR